LAYARIWHRVDASDRILGKLAERIAIVLMGKHKPIYDAAGSSSLFMDLWGMLYLLSFQADCGDYVVVTNAKKVKVSGRKEDQVLYRKHTMYPGGLKEIKYKDMMKRKPDEVRNTLPRVTRVTPAYFVL
jgi:large subunit ribosomal protein L13